MVANAIVILCTVLMAGALVWVVIVEHNAPDYDEDEKKENKENKENKEKRDSEDRK